MTTGSSSWPELAGSRPRRRGEQGGNGGQQGPLAAGKLIAGMGSVSRVGSDDPGATLRTHAFRCQCKSFSFVSVLSAGATAGRRPRTAPLQSRKFRTAAAGRTRTWQRGRSRPAGRRGSCPSPAPAGPAARPCTLSLESFTSRWIFLPSFRVHALPEGHDLARRLARRHGLVHLQAGDVDAALRELEAEDLEHLLE